MQITLQRDLINLGVWMEGTSGADNGRFAFDGVEEETTARLKAAPFQNSANPDE